MPYIHHTNSRSFNTTAGLKPTDRNNNSSKFSALDTIPYFPQQKELQNTVTIFNQSFLSRCENKTHKEEDKTCQSHILCTVCCANKAQEFEF
jgi:hypothetical protein